MPPGGSNNIIHLRDKCKSLEQCQRSDWGWFNRILAETFPARHLAASDLDCICFVDANGFIIFLERKKYMRGTGNWPKAQERALKALACLSDLATVLVVTENRNYGVEMLAWHGDGKGGFISSGWRLVTPGEFRDWAATWCRTTLRAKAKRGVLDLEPGVPCRNPVGGTWT